ncbi:MAG TPA: phosphatidate cytidylyltransferase [Paucimonas sp.]|nr:phosphatidate cytidylyltransferase [Paucimonas sp.]
MLKTRVITAVVLLAILLAILAIDSFPVFAGAATVFFGAAMWEGYRLFGNKRPVFGAAIWTAAFAFLAFRGMFQQSVLLYGLCALIWALRLTPSLKFGLPPLHGMGNRLLTAIYGVAILGCFGAILVLFQRSPAYLVSAMAIVWIADIGAYFAGKAFGKRKLAPSISPGKSWEGAVGGWLAVLAAASATIFFPLFRDTFAAQVQARFGWIVFLGVMTLLVAASVVGDLFESQLKRRIGMKDSSKLLPGHGGVLDRVDALIPTLPLAVLFGFWN